MIERLAGRDRLRDDPGERRSRAGAERASAHVCARHRGLGLGPRRRLRGGAVARNADHGAHPAPRRGRAGHRDPAAAAGDDGRARLPRGADGGRALDRHRSPLRLRGGRPSARDDRGVGREPGDLVLGRVLRLLALAHGRDRGRLGRGDRVRALGRPRPAARVPRAHALPHRSGGRDLRGAGRAPLLRLLRGDAHPAVRAGRRVGRRASSGRDPDLRRLHDGRARC